MSMIIVNVLNSTFETTVNPPSIKLVSEYNAKHGDGETLPGTFERTLTESEELSAKDLNREIKIEAGNLVGGQSGDKVFLFNGVDLIETLD